MGLRSFGAQEVQGEFESFDFTAPSLLVRAAPAGEEVFFEFVEPGQHFRVDRQHRATDACEFMSAPGAVGASARAQLDAALVEMLLEFQPFVIGGLAILVGGPLGSAALDELLVVGDDVVVEDRDVAARSPGIRCSSGPPIEAAQSCCGCLET
ncbi:hypothetical protein KO481_13135 [Nocardia sp. NEAU-G5]|uniref:Uncharacterized protein n=1 Tax=Nocardia albiluteola TaxID=2842303 RepID=A0ABS6AWP7_9NOCA|nr:hypothetical protein [Nocardia albiluteola]MBU3062463.1 hypothetical protein [Nocardia albiluteola]